MDEETGLIMCGTDLTMTKKRKGDNKDNVPIPKKPNILVQGIDSSGILKLQFDQDMNFSSLFGKDTDSARKLKSKSGGGDGGLSGKGTSAFATNHTDSMADEGKYLFSD